MTKALLSHACGACICDALFQVALFEASLVLCMIDGVRAL